MLLVVAACGSSPTPSPKSTPSPSPSPTDTASPSPTDSPTPQPTEPAPSGLVWDPLDGVATTPAKAAREPIAVTIDDSAVSRPQSGFTAASIVYQGPAEGGEQKYMFVYQENDAADIGPLRSGRPHFAAWAAEYRAIFAHFGGDRKLLAWIPSIAGTLIWDISFIVDPGSHRVTWRQPPHNAYTSTTRLREVAAAKHEPSTMVAGLPTRPFVDDLPSSQRPTSGSIHVPLPNSTIDYAYDPTGNQYLRSVNGAAEYDLATKQRVTARDVVVLYMSVTIDPQSEPGYARPLVGYLGSGKAQVFHDGHIYSGTWRKADTGSLTRFYDASGKEIPLLRGRIFIQIVNLGTNVTYRAQS